MNDAFSKSWHLHHAKMSNKKVFKEWVVRERPDVVVVQVVERALFGPQFFETDLDFADGIQNFEQVRSILTQAPFGIYWAIDGIGFSEDASTNELLTLSGNSFEVRLPLGARITKLRLDFPDALNIPYFVRNVELVGRDELIRLDLNSVESVTSHSVSTKAGVFVITGPDPYYGFRVPDMFVTEVIVRGEIR